MNSIIIGQIKYTFFLWLGYTWYDRLWLSMICYDWRLLCDLFKLLMPIME